MGEGTSRCVLKVHGVDVESGQTKFKSGEV